MPTAVVFPGQASQTPDMRDRVAAARPDLIALATELAGGVDPFERVDESTRYAQPAIFCASLVGWARVQAHLDGEAPVALAGHSLGELAALVAAGSLSEEDGLRLVTLRGALMADSGERRGDGTMLAALGGERADVERIATAHGVTVANDNAPGQLVLSGARDALQAAATELRAAGVRALELNVAGAFHSHFMADAVPPFQAALEATDVREPRVTVLSCVTAAPLTDAAEIRARLAEGLTQPVRWRETADALKRAGADTFVESGPGQVLTKMLKRMGIEAVSADRFEEAARV